MASGNLTVLILAAGKGTRMKSATAKVLHPVLGRPMLAWTLDLARSVGARRRGVVVGHGADEVASLIPGGEFEVFRQERQLGTGDAVSAGAGILEGAGDAVVLSGDTPLLTRRTLRRLVAGHRRGRAAVTLLTAVFANPRGYGRIVRDGDGRVAAIVEEKDASAAERALREVNTGTYCFDASFLARCLGRLGTDNRQGEYYLTDVVAMAVAEGRGVSAVAAEDPDEVLGVNSRRELARAQAILRDRKLGELMDAGVTVVDPATTWVDHDVKVGPDTVLLPLTFLEGETRVGRRCRIGPMARLRQSVLGAGVLVRDGCLVEGARIADSCQIGPWAHLRPGTSLARGVKIGNFVEVKASRLGRGSKANHLTYLGDATVGEGVNIGAGTITCNYDGVKKWPTVIGDGVFVGSNTELVAPVRLGKGSLVGAGTTVTRDVPPGALALSRAPQENRKGLAGRYLRKKKP